MIHCILFSVIALSALLVGKGRKMQILPFAVLFLFAALRYMYGNDYANYYRIHEYMQLGMESPFDEILFTKLFELTPHFFVVVALTSFVLITVVYQLLRRHLSAEGMCIGLFIFLINPYLFLMNLSAMRQSLAMALFICAVPFGIRRKPVQYALLICLAGLFHKSAFLLLPVYAVLGPGRFRAKSVVLVLLFLLALLWVVDIQAVVQWGVSLYNDKNYAAYAGSDMGNSLRATLLTGITFVYVLMNLPKLEGNALVHGKIYLISTMLGILAYRLSMLTRIQMYFDIYSVVALPAIFLQVQSEGPVRVDYRNKHITIWKLINKYACPVLIVLVYLLRYYSFFTNSMWQSFVTYRTIFQGM